MTPQFVCAVCCVPLKPVRQRSDGTHTVIEYECPTCGHIWYDWQLPKNIAAYLERSEVKAWLAKRDRANEQW